MPDKTPITKLFANLRKVTQKPAGTRQNPIEVLRELRTEDEPAQPNRRTETGPVYEPEMMPFTCPLCGRSEPTTARNKRRCNACTQALKPVRESAKQKSRRKARHA